MKINSEKSTFSKLFDVSRETLTKLIQYELKIISFNEKSNIIGKSTIPHIWKRHFADSAKILSFITTIVKKNENRKLTICDVGSGAGFPGMVLAIMGKKNIHLVESDYKKCVFLKEIATLTEVDITIHNCKIEDLSFINVDLITCRALAPLIKLIDYVENFTSKSKKANQKIPNLLFLKGKSYNNEILELRKSKNIDFKEYPSITDKYGKILYLSKVPMIDISNV